LVKAGVGVQVIMTDAATQFTTPLTLQALSGAPVALDLFDAASEAEIGHIRLADEADLIVVAPATADAIARMAAGLANDLLTAVVLATRAPVLLAPAMNVNMWQNPLTQANLGRLIGSGQGRISTVGPDKGELACGWVGEGRLIEPAEIAAEALRLLSAPATPAAGDRSGAGRDLAGVRVVVTAGPTHEPVDDVRFLGNRSSGKMGAALAASAVARGAEVTLIAGPGTPEAPGTRRVAFETAVDLERALHEVLRDSGIDVVVMAAAVADFRPLARVPGKLSRRKQAGGVALPLEPVPDLLAGLGRARQRGKLGGGGGRPYLVGFAAEIGGGATLETHALAKLREKRCDAIVANDVSAPGIGFGADDNQVTVFFADGTRTALARAPKRALADALWDLFAARQIAPAARGASHA
jgi:phosphopantothenoylcysteine decarboxylase / phosphopantothenate---cysteine ligase